MKRNLIYVELCGFKGLADQIPPSPTLLPLGKLYNSIFLSAEDTMVIKFFSFGKYWLTKTLHKIKYICVWLENHAKKRLHVFTDFLPWIARLYVNLQIFALEPF